MSATAKPAVVSPTEREIRDQIERIVLSVAFRTSDRLKHFLPFVAGEALQGKSDTLKEYSVGVHVFGRETAFDPRTDPVVRVQARRLRARLERYYKEEGQHDEIVVDLPKGGYAPVFRCREVTVAPKPPAANVLQDNTVVVQTITDLSPGRGLAAFCAGLTREVIRRLASLKGLRVAAPQLPPGATAAMVLEGSISQASEEIGRAHV